ncbi:hypothetical protein [Pseudoalteromonas phage PH357]|nr:hypothetical protein [Pseudoalteromonas phage PH357]
MTKKFYVYKVLVKDEVIYVGKGQGGRCSHVLSGKSHNAKLNEYYYRHTLLGDECPVVKKVKYFEEDGLALKYESYLIRDLLPDCNIRGTKEKEPPKRKTLTKKSVTKPKKKKTPKVNKIPNKPTPIKEPDVEDDNLIDLPNTYEDFIAYATSVYNEVSKGWTKHNTFRTWLYTKKIPVSWNMFEEYIDRYLEETPDAREDNGGHNKNVLTNGLCKEARNSFNSWKTYFRKSKNREPSEEECIKKIDKLKEKYND